MTNDRDLGSPADAANGWPAALTDALRADRRIVGAADVTSVGCARSVCSAASVQTLVVVTSHDGRDAIVADLPRLGALALGADAAIGRTDGTTWAGVSADLRRVEIEVVRIADLKPSARGEAAAIVFDTNGALDQWVRWSRGRNREREAALAARDPAARLLEIDDLVRQFEQLPIGAVAVGATGATRPIRPRLAAALREVRGELSGDVAVEAAIAARIDAALAACPQTGLGIRAVPGSAATGPSPADTLEVFLRVADGEGFLGDRMLFAEGVKRLTELSRRAPVFDEGFVLPTFDAVEARWRIGEASGGCKTPLVPGVYIGVGVTPADHLEFWAAPFVREPLTSVACVADAGTRVVCARTVGKDALIAACVGEVERAWDELPDFLRAARRAARTPAGDVDKALMPLHLPKSYREAAKRVVGRHLTPSRLQVALALARAGDDQDPLNARKFGLAAGRLIDTTPPGADGADGGCEAIAK
ncbi:MAG: hypothetical protein K8T90_01095 [Planctomycetes bacterium]|nr:hypothetical protein [Planctomycetota bacterium]